MIRSQMMVSRTEVVAENGVVAGGHELEAQAGVRVMQEGGNAVDALVAAAYEAFSPAKCPSLPRQAWWPAKMGADNLRQAAPAATAS